MEVGKCQIRSKKTWQFGLPVADAGPEFGGGRRELEWEEKGGGAGDPWTSEPKIDRRK